LDFQSISRSDFIKLKENEIKKIYFLCLKIKKYQSKKHKESTRKYPYLNIPKDGFIRQQGFCL